MTSPKKKQSKKEIITDAALRIIAKEGLRGLTYRSVATEADVPLGLTTYYFKGIESLYIEAYHRFVDYSNVRMQTLIQDGSKHLEKYRKDAEHDQATALDRLIKTTAKTVADYVHALIVEDRDYRLMGMAFIHAALTVPEINESVREREMQFNIASEEWFKQFGASNPSLNADMLVGIVNHAEHRCLLGMNGAKDKAYLRKTMLEFFELVLTPDQG